MSGTPSGSGTPPTKAIGSLAKKQSDVTRQGTQKMKFVPTPPGRRKKEEVKAEPTPQDSPAAASSSTSDRGSGRGRGRGDARGRGRGRGTAPPVVEMTASGPFAMGPALAGSTAARRTVPRSNFVPIPVPGSGPSSGTSTPHGTGSVKLEPDVSSKVASSRSSVNDEVYSEPDEGVEIIDMEDVKQMDWMAPDSLRVEKSKKPKKEEVNVAVATGEIDAANAIDLSESEEEEELEDIIEHFAAKADIEQNSELREENLYLFQFPSPFPKFISKDAKDSPLAGAEASSPQVKEGVKPEPGGKAAASVSKSKEVEPELEQKVDGLIGELVVYRSGAVKMRLVNGILLDVNATTQPSFLQHAAYIDQENKKLVVLGEVNKRFAVAPDVDALLAAMENKDKGPPKTFDEEGLIAMDTT